MSEAQKKVESEPCQCVYCGECGGTGNVWRNYDGLGRYVGGGIDDMSDLERCESCCGGIIETCDRCQLLMEMDSSDDFDRYLGAT